MNRIIADIRLWRISYIINRPRRYATSLYSALKIALHEFVISGALVRTQFAYVLFKIHVLFKIGIRFDGFQRDWIPKSNI